MNRQRDRRMGAGGRVRKPATAVGTGTSLFGQVHPKPPLGVHNPIRKIEHITTPHDPRKPHPGAVRS